jgi:c-di-GMP-binding flagellar brake protein YcgR
MVESENIKGGKITKAFEKLLQNKTLLTIALDNSNYEHLTRVTSLTTRNKTPYFTIDPPEGFAEAVADIGPWYIHFEFTGSDKVKYRFKTIDGEMKGRQIFIKAPRKIERLQRRRLFRIEAPKGTRLCFTLHAVQYELRVINISLGGSLSAVVQTNRQGSAPPLTPAQVLTEVELIFPQNLKRQPVKIKTVQIKRMKKNPETTHVEVAFEFYELSKGNEILLNDLIYRLQRQYLRKRLPLDV